MNPDPSAVAAATARAPAADTSSDQSAAEASRSPTPVPVTAREQGQEALLWELLAEAQAEWRDGGGDMQRERCLDAFRRFDKDDDGTISFEEFMKGWRMRCPSGKLREARLKTLFMLVDKDNNGSLEYHELQDLLLGKIAPAEKQAVQVELKQLSSDLKCTVDTAEGHEFRGVCSDILANLMKRRSEPTQGAAATPRTPSGRDTFLTNVRYLEFCTTRRPTTQNSLLPPVKSRVNDTPPSIWTPSLPPPKRSALPSWRWSNKAPVPPLQLPKGTETPRLEKPRTHREPVARREPARFAGGKKLNSQYVSVVRELVGRSDVPEGVLSVDKALETLGGRAQTHRERRSMKPQAHTSIRFRSEVF